MKGSFQAASESADRTRQGTLEGLEESREDVQPKGGILAVRLGSFGDIVLTLPALPVLREKFPGQPIHWLTEPQYAPFLRCIDGISRVWIADTKRWRKHPLSSGSVVELIRRLRARRFVAAIDFQGLMKSAVLTRLSGAGQVIGHASSQTRERAAAFFYTERRKTVATGRHQLERHLDLADPPRFQGRATSAIGFRPCPEDQSFVIDALGMAKSGAGPVLLNPGGGWVTKRWAIERFSELADRIERELGLPTILTPAPGEEELVRQFMARIRFARTQPLMTSFTQLACLCRRAALMVAGDTGPMHLAVAMGTPVVAILGPADPKRTGPFSPSDLVVRHDRACPRPYQRTCADHFCMDIPVERVFKAVVRRLESSSGEIPRSERVTEVEGEP